MKIKPMTTLGEVCDRFREKAVAFDIAIQEPSCESWSDHALIGEFARTGLEAGQVTINDDQDLCFPADTLVVVLKNSIRWEHKGRYYEMRFYSAEPMEIA